MAIRKAAITSSRLSFSIDKESTCPVSLFMSFPSYQREGRKAIGFLMLPQTTNEPFVMLPVSVAFDTTLSPYAIRLYAALEHFSGQHMTCWPGYTALAALVGCTPRWIPFLLGNLVKAGLLAVQYRQGKTNIYTLLKRVSRQPRATQEAPSSQPTKSNNYEQKQPTKTNKRGGYNPPKNFKEPPTSEKFAKTAAFLAGKKVKWSVS